MQLTVDATLRRAAREFPQRSFLRFDNGDVTFAETHSQVNAVALGLVGLGVVPGARVAILMPNRLEFVLAWFAANRLGAVVVPVNTQVRGPALARVLNQTGAAVLVADPDLLESIVAIADQLAALRHVVLTDTRSWDVARGRFDVTSMSELTRAEP